MDILRTVNPLDYCSDTFRPVIKTMSQDVMMSAIIGKPSKNSDGIEFCLALNPRELLVYHEVNQRVFDVMENSFYVAHIAKERMMIIIALKMLNIDNEHCKF